MAAIIISHNQRTSDYVNYVDNKVTNEEEAKEKEEEEEESGQCK